MNKHPPISIEDAEALIIAICDKAGIFHSGGITQDKEHIMMSNGEEYDINLLKRFNMVLTA